MKNTRLKMKHFWGWEEDGSFRGNAMIAYYAIFYLLIFLVLVAVIAGISL